MNKIHCKIFGHDFRVTRRVTNHVNEYKCENCKKQYTTSVNGNLTELTSKFKEINNVLERMYKKRAKKKIELNPSIENLLTFSH